MQSQKKSYEKIMKIGEGAYGAVYKAIDLQTKQMVALKITKFDIEDEGIPSTTLREISILKSLSHKNIVRLLDVDHDSDKDEFIMQLVFEYMEEDLGKFIRRRKDNISQLQCKKIFKQIVEGVKYMHERNVYHRDLKPQNILISNSEVKIADFGLSRVINNPNRTFSKEIETLWYRSPELLLGVQRYGKNVDIWSLGCILYELVEGKVLFKGDSEISQIFVIFQYLGTPRISQWPQLTTLPHFKKTFPKMHPKNIGFSKLSLYGKDLLMRLIQLNPKNRITLNEIISHPFFQ